MIAGCFGSFYRTRLLSSNWINEFHADISDFIYLERARKTNRIQVYSLSYRFVAVTLIPLSRTSRPSFLAATTVLQKLIISRKSFLLGRDQLSLLIFNSFLKIFFLASCNILSVAISLEDKGAVLVY